MTAKTKAATVKVEIRHWYRDEVLFSAEVDATLSKGAQLKVALEKAALDGARLDGARLDGARLVGASLDGASLVGARLDGARLDGASLVGARLDGARLVGASLVGASLVGALGIIDIGTPNGWRLVAVRHESGIMVAAGCRWFTFSAAVSHWRNRQDRKETRAALEYIRALCNIKGWKLGEDAPVPTKEAA